MVRAASSARAKSVKRESRPRKSAGNAVKAPRKMRPAGALKVTPALIAAHGLTPEEYQRIRKLIGREPSFTELGIFSAMWNEHCSYKSSKVHLRTLPTAGRCVIQGPGENAGVIDIGDGLACVFKMESHNHPSYIEPYQGAATGVGGILRDVFTMGARPIACLNALSFGAPMHPKTRHLVSGVVAGIGGYGNSFGVPTVGGSVRFHTRYDRNCLVNAMAVGIAETDKIFYAAASGVGMPIVYLGSKRGRDGIHGATMASAEFGADAEEKRPTVQVGDPFSEKLLLEACLEQKLLGERIADLHGRTLLFRIRTKLRRCHGGTVYAVAATLGAEIDDRHADAGSRRVEDLVGLRNADRHGIDQTIAVIAGVKTNRAADGGHAEGIAIAADAGNDARDQVARLRVHRRPEGKRVEAGDRPCPHGEDVAQNAADPGRCTLIGLDVTWVVVALHLEDAGEPIPDVDHAG